MTIYTALSIFLLAGLAISQPTVLSKNDGIPYGAFPSSASSASLPSATPITSSNAHLGRAVVVNHCQTPVYIWSVGSTVRSPATVRPGNRHSETFRHDAATGGIALKISTVSDGLYTSAPLTIFAYNLNGQQVWYDLSDVFGDPFKGHSVVVSPAEPELSWANGVPPSGSHVRVSDASTDLVLTLC
ncbi:Antigenic thaumatin-like protein [Penicillium canariense]|uniref:Antigenic thaumatin-like protein n=1 Tax=Penicillium canariense TaxID=189055 RepID=A0A9W9LPJ9_9EURO|nr:Antigenic thaumatin-like protein [Penicillium canariense]KAJ5168837.1 Antigenic thaumatin-like protein [Penicillium canariense]